MYLFQIDLKTAIVVSIKQIIRKAGLESNKLSKNKPIITPTITPATNSTAILNAALPPLKTELLFFSAFSLSISLSISSSHSSASPSPSSLLCRAPRKAKMIRGGLSASQPGAG